MEMRKKEIGGRKAGTEERDTAHAVVPPKDGIITL